MSNFLNFIKRRGDVLVDRGDPASYDFTVGDFTCDDNWHDLDLSSIIPSGAACVKIKIAIMDDEVSSSVAFRKNGNSNGIATFSTTTQTANRSLFGQGWVACDSNRVIEYKASNLEFTAINLVVTGWIMPGDVNDALKTDGTAGRVFRTAALLIKNGTNASTLKCQLISRFNGDAIAETDNIAKGATTGNFTLDSAGQALTILNSGITGTPLWASGVLIYNKASVTAGHQIAVSGSDIVIYFWNPATGANYDLTVLVDTGQLTVDIYYITDA